MRIETLKQALIAVCVGVAITLVTSIAQELVHWLNGFVDNLAGGSAGAAYYAAKNWRNFV